MSTGYFRLIPKFSASSVEQVALPRLEYLFLGRWILQWDSFVRPITTDLPSSSVAPFIEGHPHLSIPAIKMVALHNCQGYPNGVVGLNGKHEGDEDVDMGEEGKLTMRWLSELRNVWPLVNGKDGVVDSVMGNIGTGSW